MDKDKLTQEDVTSLCDAAQAAWREMGPRGTRAVFTWRGQKFVASHSSFRLKVDTLDGTPIASRHD